MLLNLRKNMLNILIILGACIAPFPIIGSRYSFNIYNLNVVFLLCYILLTFCAIKENKFVNMMNFIFVLIAAVIPMLILHDLFDIVSYPRTNYFYFICIAMCMAFLFRKLKKDELISEENLDKKDYIAFIYVVLIFIATINSIYLKQSIAGAMYWYEGFGTLCCYIILFLLASRYYVFSKIHIYILSLSALIISLVGIIQNNGIDLIYKRPADALIDVYGTIGNRNSFGSYLVLILPIFIFAFLFSSKKVAKLTFLVISCMLYYCLLATFTRGAWIGFAASIFTCIFVTFRYKKPLFKELLFILGGFIIITILFCSFCDGFAERMASIAADANSVVSKSTDYQNSGSGRIKIWEMTLGIIHDKPLLGSGPETLNLAFIKKYGHGLDYGGVVTKAHNEYLNIAATTGVPALLCYIIILGIIIYKAIKKAKNNSLLLPLLCSIIGYLVQAAFSISVAAVAPIFWIILGVTYKLSKEA
ncbi:MAG: O-antigen ligase family protein [Bacillota bacterium]|nr:O-antigen ligase family protein [Bacillota bacterium]